MSTVGKPLNGIKVVDLTHALSGPFATQMLVDLGADVVKVESEEHPDDTRRPHPFVGDTSHYFLAINHGKRGLGLDLKNPRGREVLLRLVEKADVIVSNFRAGTLEKLDLAPALLAQRNPRLVQCMISGFGQQEGMFRKKAVYDANIQSLSGFMSVTGEVGGAPMRCGVSIGDLFPGLFAVQSIIAALLQREKTGRGQVLDVPMFDCMFNLLTYYITHTQAAAEAPLPSGSMHVSVAPMGRFDVKDGWIIVAAFTEEFWRKLCRAIECPHFVTDPRFVTMAERLQNRQALMEELQAVFKRRTKQEWMGILDSHDVPNSPVLDVMQVLSHPIVKERNLLRPQQLGEGLSIGVSRHPVIFGTQVPEVEPAQRVPRIGEHTAEILEDWLNEGKGYMAEMIAAGALESNS